MRKDRETKIQHGLNDSDYLNKRRFWDRKFWKKKNGSRSNHPLPGALECKGTDRNGRKIVLPAGWYKESSMRVRTAADANEITSDYMGHVQEKLAPYTIRNKNKHS